MASLTSTTETAPVVGITSNTMFDPAFIAGLTNTFDGTNATLSFTQNLPELRRVDELDSTDFIVVCNKAADLTFTWQINNVRNFPSTGTTTLSNGNVNGLDVVAITSVVGEENQLYHYQKSVMRICQNIFVAKLHSQHLLQMRLKIAILV